MEWMVAGILVLVAWLFIWLFYRYREKQLLTRIREMLEHAVAGDFKEVRYDESMLSSVESAMKRFLEDCEVGQKNMEEQKARIQTMISDISHQTVTPLSNILLYTQLLDEREDLEPVKTEITAIREQAEKLDFLITSLVKSSRLETGIINVKKKQIQVQEIFDQIEGQFREPAAKKQIALEIEPTEETAYLDKKWTTEAVCNIVDNAIKYTNPGGKVHIEVIPYTIFLRLDISDTGIGISEDEHSRIFSRFYRSPRVSEEKGVGIGLYLAREIVSVQGGYMKVQSELGKGSAFSIYLPREMSQNCDISETSPRQ